MKIAALVALAGVATLASAQLNPIVTISHNDADDIVNVGDVVTWTVSISWTSNGALGGGDDYMFGANLKFDAAGGIGGTAGARTQGAGVLPGTTFNGGGATGLSIDNVTFADAFGGQFGRADANGAAFVLVSWTTTIESGNVGDTLSYSADKRSLGTTAALTVASGGAFAPPFVTNNFQTNADFEVVSDRVQIVPTPGALALLGLGGLAAGRRRR
jgi:hypothetical protein